MPNSMHHNTERMTDIRSSKDFAAQMDAADPLRGYRERFHLPRDGAGQALVYLCGNSLGLQPKSVATYVNQELQDWAELGVEGHFHAQRPWMPYHELLAQDMAAVVGAKPHEVVVMNSLTVNLHLMMVSFYRPTPQRYKILIESDAFPSDRYAAESQLRYHGYDPATALLELRPRPGEVLIREEDIAALLEREGEQVALLLLGGVNYYTGQVFDAARMAALGHRHGCVVGLDMAHAAGNLPLALHDSGVDFAVWCTYKYLNSGPGSVGGCFVHERHAEAEGLPRFAGWWGHNKATRFNMRHAFDPMPGAEGWQLSNPPILALAPVRASLDLFAEVGMAALRHKSEALTGYLYELLSALPGDRLHIITPSEAAQRGCQLSIQVRGADKSLFTALSARGVVADWREPDVIRVAPVPLYNSFEDVWRFVQVLSDC